MKDLICLVADKNMEYAIRGLLGSPIRVGIREITFDIFVHPEHDPGCYNAAHSFLRSFSTSYTHGLVLFDYDGCGQEISPPTHVQTHVKELLDENGWEERANVVVINPELEIWVWSDSPRVDECLGWQGQNPDLRTWLRQKGLLEEDRLKPNDPKTALEEALRTVRKQRSSALFKQLAERVSLNRCTDDSFIYLRSTLRRWFPSE